VTVIVFAVASAAIAKFVGASKCPKSEDVLDELDSDELLEELELSELELTELEELELSELTELLLTELTELLLTELTELLLSLEADELVLFSLVVELELEELTLEELFAEVLDSLDELDVPVAKFVHSIVELAPSV
jgi:hypothetical protein